MTQYCSEKSDSGAQKAHQAELEDKAQNQLMFIRQSHRQQGKLEGRGLAEKQHQACVNRKVVLASGGSGASLRIRDSDICSPCDLEQTVN